MHSRDARAVVLAGVVESVASDTLRGIVCDQLDALHDTIHDFVLDARVLALGVLTDQHRVDVLVRRLTALDRHARAHVGKEVERAAQRQVQRDVALADRRRQGSLEGDRVAAHRLDRFLRDDLLALVVDRGRHVRFFPLDRNVSGTVNLAHGTRHLRANTVTREQRHGVLAVRVLLLVVGRRRGVSLRGEATAQHGRERARSGDRAGDTRRSSGGSKKHGQSRQPKKGRPLDVEPRPLLLGWHTSGLFGRQKTAPTLTRRAYHRAF